MRGHLPTMHKTDKADALWMTCGCGWSSPKMPCDGQEEADKVGRFLVRLWNEHYAASEKKGEQ